MGKNCVLEVLKSSPERIVKIYLSSKDPDLHTLIENEGIEIVDVRRDKLSDTLSTDSHQGIAAQVKEKQQLSLDQYLDHSFYQDID